MEKMRTDMSSYEGMPMIKWWEWLKEFPDTLDNLMAVPGEFCKGLSVEYDRPLTKMVVRHIETDSLVWADCERGNEAIHEHLRHAMTRKLYELVTEWQKRPQDRHQ